MGMFDSLKQMLNKNEDEFERNEYEQDEYYDEEDEVEPVQKPVYTQRSVSKNMQVVIIKPNIFDDGKEIISHVRNNHPVIVNFEETDSPVARRILDFLSGGSFALNGKVETIGANIYLIVPESVSVDKGEQNYAEISDQFVSWKEQNL